MKIEALRVTSDLVINYKDWGIVLIKRKYPPYKNFWALPGGHLETGQENSEQAAIREAEEETNLKVNIKDLNLLGVYSNPHRDPRGHYVTVAYFTHVAEGDLQAMDDAKEIGVFNPLKQLPLLAFDHQQIIEDYLRRKVS